MKNMKDLSMPKKKAYNKKLEKKKEEKKKEEQAPKKSKPKHKKGSGTLGIRTTTTSNPKGKRRAA